MADHVYVPARRLTATAALPALQGRTLPTPPHLTHQLVQSDGWQGDHALYRGGGTIDSTHTGTVHITTTSHTHAPRHSCQECRNHTGLSGCPTAHGMHLLPCPCANTARQARCSPASTCKHYVCADQTLLKILGLVLAAA